MSESVTPRSLRPTPLELAAGMPLGEQQDQAALPDVPASLTPRGALEDAVREVLRRPPCFVAFSGGRDSSAILALAAHVARREALPLPIPVTYLFPGVPKAEESSWQELVIRHLGLRDWIRTEVTDEFDVLGPEATAVLRRHGALVPFGAYAQRPLLREASGGVLLTGFDGDGLFTGWRWERAASLWSRRQRFRSRDVLSLALAGAPARARVSWVAHRSMLHQPWLRPHVRRAVVRAFAVEVGAQPTRWDRRIDWYARRRPVVLPRLTIDLVGREVGTTVRHPFVEPRFLAAVARSGARSGAGDRTDWMRALFADLLPAEVIVRSDKADLEDAVWGRHSRRFIDEWDGSGVDVSVVEPDALHAAWKARQWSSLTLLQVAWLASVHAPQDGSTPADLAARR